MSDDGDQAIVTVSPLAGDGDLVDDVVDAIESRFDDQDAVIVERGR
jgi:hypothetical protein